jgi:hypothetical protein
LGDGAQPVVFAGRAWLWRLPQKFETLVQVMERLPFLVEVSEEQIRRERQRARALRDSQWWKRKRGLGICHHCGEKFPPDDLTMDHLVPIIRGGKSTKGNLVPSCKKCNSERKHRLPFEQNDE